jgi:NTP pyrophosphatase (non-canonical NTP hydrolase)
MSAASDTRGLRVHPPFSFPASLRGEQNWWALFNSVVNDIHAKNREKGFWDKRKNLLENPKTPLATRDSTLEFVECLAHIASEIGELIEATRHPEVSDPHCPGFSNVEIELADLFIRIADLAGGCQLRLAEAIQAKLIYNQTRPYRHGKES